MIAFIIQISIVLPCSFHSHCEVTNIHDHVGMLQNPVKLAPDIGAELKADVLVLQHAFNG